MYRHRLAILALTLLAATALPGYQEMTPAEYLNLINTTDSLVMIDVRESGEYDGGHIAGAHLFPLNSQVFQAKVRELPAGYPIGVNCGSGLRSKQAAAILDTIDNGIHAGKIYNLTSGLGSWPYPTVKGGQDGPELTVGRDSLAFGPRSAGETAWDTLRVANVSSHGVAVVLLANFNPAFACRPDTACILPGDTLRLAVSFTPAAGVTDADTLKVLHAGLGRYSLKLHLAGSGMEAHALKGDLDGNGKVDVFDLLELLKVLSGAHPDSTASDLDGNGKTDVFDLLELLKVLGGKG
ncbi:dockerin type I domain-containing protein [bacterium]|nr:dockerin type I domain-containing protein [bacterium]